MQKVHHHRSDPQPDQQKRSAGVDGRDGEEHQQHVLGQHQQEEEGVGEEELLWGVRAVNVHHYDAGGENTEQKLCNVGDGAAKIGN